MLASFAFEVQAEGVFECLPKTGQSGEVSSLDAQPRIASIRGENAGHFLWGG